MLRCSIRLSLIAALFASFPCLSAAETRIVSLEEQSQWNAVGRVNKGGFKETGACTGTLVASDLVLTATHCTPHSNTPEALASYTFVAGWNRGEYAATSTFAQVYVHPDFEPGALTVGKLETDIALVRLTDPIPANVVAPLLLGRVPQADLGFVGYRNGRLHAPEITTACRHNIATDHVLFMGCKVVSGNSGSPVLDFTPVGPRVVGVVSATTGIGALSVVLQDWMRPYLPDAW